MSIIRWIAVVVMVLMTFPLWAVGLSSVGESTLIYSFSGLALFPVLVGMLLIFPLLTSYAVKDIRLHVGYVGIIFLLYGAGMCAAFGDMLEWSPIWRAVLTVCAMAIIGYVLQAVAGTYRRTSTA